MRKAIQAPIPREDFQKHLMDRCSTLNVRRNDGAVLSIESYQAFPQIKVLFVAEPEKFHDTVEICGMHDEKTGEFRFLNDRLAGLVEGIQEPERCDSNAQSSEEIYEGICRYAKEAVEQKGYQFDSKLRQMFVEQKESIQAGLSAIPAYAAQLSVRGETDAVQEIREYALKMLDYWKSPVYGIYERGYEKVRQQYEQKIDGMVLKAAESGRPPQFDADGAAQILNCLAVHAAEAAVSDGNADEVRPCCRIAERILDEYPEIRNVFQGNFQNDPAIAEAIEASRQEPDGPEQGMMMGGPGFG